MPVVKNSLFLSNEGIEVVGRQCLRIVDRCCCWHCICNVSYTTSMGVPVDFGAQWFAVIDVMFQDAHVLED